MQQKIQEDAKKIEEQKKSVMLQNMAEGEKRQAILLEEKAKSIEIKKAEAK